MITLHARPILQEPLTPDFLARAGTALFGAQWVSPLARELNVTPRTMRRWKSGASPIPLTAADRLAAVLAARWNLQYRLLQEKF